VAVEAAGPAWWAVDSGGAVQAGPFGSRAEAACAEPPTGDDWSEVEELRPAYGSRGPSGGLEERLSPADRAFEANLDERLARVPSDLVADGAGLRQVVRAVATALVEAEFTLHDCAGRPVDAVLGGVCLTPSPDQGGVIVTWTQHDRLAAAQGRGAGVHAEVQAVMNDALFQVLQALGFGVEPFSEHDVALVRSATPAGSSAPVGVG